MKRQLDSAIIVKKKDGTYGIDFRKGAPTSPADAEIIEVLQRKDGETETAFRERAIRYLHEEVP